MKKVTNHTNQSLDLPLANKTGVRTTSVAAGDTREINLDTDSRNAKALKNAGAISWSEVRAKEADKPAAPKNAAPTTSESDKAS
jgi:hypothetical protein